MTTSPSTPTTHIYFLLDRSGSMATIADEVIEGFNSFLAEQQEDGDDAVMTFVQFDTEDSFEVLASACPIREVTRLDPDSFVPRGGTPLYDAMGLTIGLADSHARRRERDGLDAESIVFMTFTDGMENASVEFTRSTVFEMVSERDARGWSFVYLGANQDAYEASDAIGYDGRSSQNFLADEAGTRVAFASLAKATKERRRKQREGEVFDRKDFFEGDKPADDDQATRGGA